jgi:methyl-accepting chemotaxis protein
MFSRKSGSLEHQTADRVAVALEAISGSNSRKEIVADPRPDVVNGRETYTFSITVPVVNDRTNEVVGIVGVIILADGVQPLVEQAIRANEDITAMAIYSDDGYIFGSYEADRVGKNMLEADAGLFGSAITEAQQAVQEGNLYHTKQYSSVLKTNLQIVLYPFIIGESGASWSVMIGTSEAFILKEVNRLTREVILIAVIVAILVAVVIFFVLSSTVKPIVNVAATLKDISEGEGDLTRTVNVQSKDEIGDLARYFNATLEKIKALIITIKNQSVALFDIGNELASNMTETAAAINEITANIQSIKGRVINQSASVTETNATMEQITLYIDKLNDNVEKQSASVSKSSSAI